MNLLKKLRRRADKLTKELEVCLATIIVLENIQEKKELEK